MTNPKLSHDRTLQVTDPAGTPAISLLLGFGAMVPLAVGALVAWVMPQPWRDLARDATLLWGCAIMLFLSGVRRGVSFRMPNGATVAQLATMLWLFLLGLAALPLIPNRVAPMLLIVGYLSIAVLDPIAARRAEAPLFFARLRPIQMAIPVISLGAILALPTN